MDGKSSKVLSWSLSLLVHAVFLFFVIRAGIHYAIPEGEVVTGNSIAMAVDTTEGAKGVQVDVVTKKVPEPPSEAVTDQSIPSAPAAHEEKDKVAPELPTQKEGSVTETTENEPPPKFVPYKEPQDVIPEDKPETSDDQEPVAKVLPPKETHPEQNENPRPQDMKAVQESAEPTALETPRDSQPQAPARNSLQDQSNAGNSDQAQVPTSQQNGSNQNGQEAPPPFGTAGTMLDESKLVEIPGNEKPSYPWMAKLRRQEGTVVLRAFIRNDGRVDLPILAKSSGYPLLDRECLRAYSHWRYKPGPSGWVLKPFRFILKK